MPRNVQIIIEQSVARAHFLKTINFAPWRTSPLSSPAVPLGLLAEAEKAAFLKDVKAHVTAKHVHRAVSLWDESRVWDPGD